MEGGDILTGILMVCSDGEGLSSSLLLYKSWIALVSGGLVRVVGG